MEWQGNAETYEDEEERRVLFGALSSFYQYAKVAHFNTTHLRRQSFYALPRAHWELLARPPFSYLETLDAVDEAIDKNSELAIAILKAGLESFGLSQPGARENESKNPSDWRGVATSNDLEKARSTLRQFFRDWSEEGQPEREACYGPVMKALEHERQRRSNSKMRVLVPGAGLGRLVFELCRAGFDAEGNEISYHQLLASSYILNHCPSRHAHTLHPWVHSFSNHKKRANHLRSVKIPDVIPAEVLGSIGIAGEMSMSASDFLLLYGGEDQKDGFDAVTTVFFLDTAPNIIRYIEVIRNCLKTGGLLINMGPLLWHFENNAPGTHGREKDSSSSDQGNSGIADPGSVELTNEELLALVNEFGFDMVHEGTSVEAPYIQDKQSMIQNTYIASHWVARKR